MWQLRLDRLAENSHTFDAPFTFHAFPGNPASILRWINSHHVVADLLLHHS